MRAADRYQLLERLERWVVENVLQAVAPQAARLGRCGVRFTINLTGQSISQPSFADFVRTAVKQHNVPAELLSNPRSEALVRALVLIAQQLELETVAEFVETEAVAARLRTLGVRYAQGYLYGKARPLVDALDELLVDDAAVALVARA